MERQRSNELHDHAEEIQKLTSLNSQIKIRGKELEKKNADLLLRLQKYESDGSRFKQRQSNYNVRIINIHCFFVG